MSRFFFKYSFVSSRKIYFCIVNLFFLWFVGNVSVGYTLYLTTIIHLTTYGQWTCTFYRKFFRILYHRGLQFYTFFGISIGITRRMIDIGKKITFYFLQNVWNLQFFSHLHLKYAKSAIMTQKFFFFKNINMGIKKTQNFMLISNSLMPAFRNARDKS